jgi:hypothetical protein
MTWGRSSPPGQEGLKFKLRHYQICEREVQALLHDHIECGKHWAADVVAKALAVLTEPELLRAMFDVGYFPPNTPPG